MLRRAAECFIHESDFQIVTGQHLGNMLRRLQRYILTLVINIVHEKRLPFKIVVDRACFAVCTASFRKGCNARLYRASVSQTFGDLPYRQILDAPRLRKPVFDFSDFRTGCLVVKFLTVCVY